MEKSSSTGTISDTKPLLNGLPGKSRSTVELQKPLPDPNNPYRRKIGKSRLFSMEPMDIVCETRPRGLVTQ